MQSETRDKWLRRAEVIDSLRIFPRITIWSWGLFTAFMVAKTLLWYFAEPAVGRGIEETGTVSMVVASLTGFWFKIYQDYSSKGRDWNNVPPPVPPAAPGKTVD